MTTDTAVRVTRVVVQDKREDSFSPLRRRVLTDQITAVPLEQVPYVDHPEIKIDEHESTEMPFRYVKGEDGRPVMPEVRRYLLGFLWQHADALREWWS